MNATTSRKAPATKAKLSTVTIDLLTLTPTESRLIFASRKVDAHAVGFYIDAIEQFAADYPVAKTPTLRLVQGGAACAN